MRRRPRCMPGHAVRRLLPLGEEAAATESKSSRGQRGRVRRTALSASPRLLPRCRGSGGAALRGPSRPPAGLPRPARRPRPRRLIPALSTSSSRVPAVPSVSPVARRPVSAQGAGPAAARPLIALGQARAAASGSWRSAAGSRPAGA